MRVASNSASCGVCGSVLVKNGRTTAGNQRWRCLKCGASATRSRADLSRRHELEAFLGWLLGKQTQAEAMAVNDRSFRRITAWCWNIAPEIPAAGEVHDEVQLDGIYLGSWCALIATAGAHVIGWQWCDTEKSAAWAALLERFPAPRVVVCDGGAGLASAIRKAWPETRVQRCLVHVHRNVRAHLTYRPRLEAGKTLLRLSRALMRLKTAEEAAAWANALNDWHTRWGPMLKQRTQRTEGSTAPSWVNPSQQWWYTHKRLRSAYYLLERLVKTGTLFTHLAPEHEDLDISSTTNRIEGGVNAQLRLLLKHHRGMSENHMKRAVEWWLYTHSECPTTPHALICPEHWEQDSRTPKTSAQEQIGPAEYGTATTAEEGLWPRYGWGGRSR